MSIITITRQAGSGGNTIARTVAETHGYRLVTLDDLRQEAIGLGLRLPPSLDLVNREDALLATVDDVERRAFLASASELEFDHALRGDAFRQGQARDEPLATLLALRGRLPAAIAAVVNHLAEASNVVMVQCSAEHFVGGLPAVRSIAIIANAAVRAARIAQDYDLSDHAATTAVTRSDELQTTVTRELFGGQWLDPLAYDLTVNTDLLSADQAAQAIVAISQQENGVATSPRAFAAASRINVAIASAPLHPGSVACAWVEPGPNPTVAVEGTLSSAAEEVELFSNLQAIAGDVTFINRLTH